MAETRRDDCGGADNSDAELDGPGLWTKYSPGIFCPQLMSQLFNFLNYLLMRRRKSALFACQDDFPVFSIEGLASVIWFRFAGINEPRPASWCVRLSVAHSVDLRIGSSRPLPHLVQVSFKTRVSPWSGTRPRRKRDSGLWINYLP